MKYLLFLIIFNLILCSACSAEMEEQRTRPTLNTTAETISVEDDAFYVDVWVDDPEPEPGSRVMLYGSLIKYGVYLGGMMMNAFWPAEGQHPSIPNCKVQVIYGSGVCIVETDEFTPGVPVILRVEFVYEGRTYSGSTQITPR